MKRARRALGVVGGVYHRCPPASLPIRAGAVDELPQADPGRPGSSPGAGQPNGLGKDAPEGIAEAAEEAEGGRRFVAGGLAIGE